MNERELKIVEAAFRTFSQYGVLRTGISDIAKAADISRQTLYNTFRNKDEVLRATIRLFTDQAIDEIGRKLEQEIELEARLDIVFEEIAVKPYLQLHASPHAEDLIQGMNAASQEEIEQSDERFCEVIAGILKPYETGLEASGLAIRGLADLVQKSASAIKHRSASESHLRNLLDDLKKLVLNSAV